MRVEDLLNFRTDLNAFSISASYVITEAMVRQIKSVKEELGQLQDACEQSATLPVANIMHAFLKFKAGFKKGKIDEFFQEKHLYRKLAYALALQHPDYAMILSSEQETKTALNLIDSKWKDNYIVGLFGSLLEGWEEGNPQALQLLRNFLSEKVKNYQGSRKIVENIKKNSSYFMEEDGPQKLGLELFYNKIPLENAPSYLSFSKHWFRYGYFSKVIAVYFEKARKDKENSYPQLLEILELHDNINTYKRVLSKMITEMAVLPIDPLKETIKKVSFRKIGDPAHPSLWGAPLSFSQEESRELEKSRKILNTWLIGEFINAFFDICINDESRKKFWLKQLSLISNFRIFGSVYMQDRIQRNDRLTHFLKTKFHATSSGLDIAAIMIVINNHLFIEFSDVGFACLAYQLDNPDCPKLSAPVSNVAHLRTNNLSFITQDMKLYNNYLREGKFRHSGNWEGLLEDYILEVVCSRTERMR